MNDVSLRAATLVDLPAIVALLADDSLGQQREDASIPPNQAYENAFTAIDADPNQVLAVAEHELVLVGCLQITFIPGLSRLGMLRGQIESVRIKNDYRGKGLGRTMIEWAIAECRERGCGLIQLTTDKSRANAIQFYASLGFEASHEGMKRSP